MSVLFTNGRLVLKPVAPGPQLVVATLPGIISQYHTLPAVGSKIVSGNKILLPERLLSNPVCNLPMERQRNVGAMFFSAVTAEEDSSLPKIQNNEAFKSEGRGG